MRTPKAFAKGKDLSWISHEVLWECHASSHRFPAAKAFAKIELGARRSSLNVEEHSRLPAVVLFLNRETM
jgi:hypothetical protein